MKTTLVAEMLQPRMRPDEGTVGFNHGSLRDWLTVSGGKEFGKAVIRDYASFKNRKVLFIRPKLGQIVEEYVLNLSKYCLWWDVMHASINIFEDHMPLFSSSTFTSISISIWTPSRLQLDIVLMLLMVLLLCWIVMKKSKMRSRLELECVCVTCPPGITTCFSQRMD